jgi:RNA polymerase sigma factor (sigma-70 family)
MSHGSLNTVLHYLRRMTVRGPDEGPDDTQLLQRYTRHRDDSAFAVLVRRHGPMVWGVCSRMLPRAEDAEDAFQATFLVLVRKARTLRGPESVGPWLYGVAQRTALKARTRGSRRRAEELLVEPPAAEATPEVVWRDLRPVLDEEVNRLPDRYRAPFLLCYLEGVTNEEAARRLGCPKGTVLSRLSRAREMLRDRLSRRGLGVSGAMLAVVLEENASKAALPAALVEAATRASLAFAARGAGPLSAQAVLAEGVLRSMFVLKLKLAALFLLTLGVAGSGVGLLGHRLAAQPPVGGGTDAAQVAEAAQKIKDPVKMPETGEGEAAEPADSDARARELQRGLTQPIKFNGLEDPKTPLSEALDQLAMRYHLAFNVNEEAFKQDNLTDVLKCEIVAKSPIPGMNTDLANILRKMLARVPVDSGATFLIRRDHIEITTQRALRTELGIEEGRYLYPLVWEILDEMPLKAALKKLSVASGISVVLDPRAADKATTKVSARLINVPTDTAVRLLADMADLQMVRLDNVFYVTTLENATRWRDPEDPRDQLPFPKGPNAPKPESPASKPAPGKPPAKTGM